MKAKGMARRAPIGNVVDALERNGRSFARQGKRAMPISTTGLPSKWRIAERSRTIEGIQYL
jgi:5-enolpyruvylshikimate-3-phosphate synthase